MDELDLSCESARPDDGGEDGDECEAEKVARAPSESCVVKDEKGRSLASLPHHSSESPTMAPAPLQRPIQCA